MKILHVITTLLMGGAEHLLVDLLPRLKRQGHDVELVVFNGKRTPFYEQLESEGIKIHGFPENEGVYSFKHIFRLRRLMSHFDIVHTHNTACQMFAAIVKPKDTILITTEHSTSTRRRKYFFFRYIDKMMYSRYDKIICISKPSEESLKKYIGDSFPITTVLNGVNIQRFLHAEKIDLGLQNCFVITMVAGFRYEKDQPTLIRSLLFLPDNFHLVLVGDGEKRLEIESLISELNLGDRVHLLGLRNDVPNILKSSNVVVMSSHREGLSLSNVEGMASGNPFIASDVEGLREVTAGYGLLFPHGDSKTLSDIIKRLYTDHVFAEHVASRCVERSLQFDIQSMVNGYLEIYNVFMSKC